MARQTISGLKELAKELEKLGRAVREKDMAFATRKGAQVIQQLAQAKAPKDSGKLAENIVVRKDKDTIFDSEYLVAVRTTGKADNPKNAFYAYFVEYGTENTPGAAVSAPGMGRSPHRSAERIQAPHQQARRVAQETGGQRPALADLAGTVDGEIGQKSGPGDHHNGNEYVHECQASSRSSRRRSMRSTRSARL